MRVSNASGPRGRRSFVPSYSASVTAPFATANSAATFGGGGHASLSLTHAGFESRIMAARSLAAQSESLSSYHTGNSALISGAESEERANHLRKLRRIQQQNTEWAMQYQLENEAREKERRLTLQQQDRMLAEALLQERAEEAREANERRRVCEGSEEIAELTSKLNAARINAERHSQLVQRQQLAVEEKESERAIHEEQQKQRAKEEQAKLEQVKQVQAAAEERARVLRVQCEEKEQAKAMAYSDFLKEKAAIDSIVQRLAAEDAEKAAKKRAAQEELQLVIHQYLMERAEWRAEEQRKAQEELAAIAAYTADMEERRQRQQQRMKEKNERDDLIYAAISAELERKEREREGMERMLEELYTEQKEQEQLREVQLAQERAEQLRQEMRRENEAVLQRKREAREAAVRAEKELQAQMALQLERDAAFEAASREKRARMKLRYQREIEEALQAKQRREEEAQHEEERRAEQQRRARQRELDIVESERERLLMELAAQLQPFLPKGVYRNAEEQQRIQDKHRQQNNNNNNNNNAHTAIAPTSASTSPLPASFPASLSSSVTAFASQNSGPTRVQRRA